MPEFTVHLINTVSSSVTVEADSPEDAINKAYDSDDMPSGITVGAFGSASVDDGEWIPSSVSDSNHKTVWSEND